MRSVLFRTRALHGYSGDMKRFHVEFFVANFRLVGAGPGVYGYDTCDLCERTLLESPLQLPQTTESSNGSTISAFPLADVETDHVCNNPPPAPKPIK